ncbi:NUDIX hydrolase [Streptococcus phocae subsp. phocae]|uniref:NUDIX hydrolase n=1 Tax=Streptococcus phocae TaxID=119224 RepID=A0A0P6S1U4_9STRE|nr:NUDIX hydrolase [Streptococcus phocae]KGR72433.1 NUDIX hydrolase [Streptococcus phocae subsp. salmonis]KPJ22486.1 NUDIX hydrolase [Streptococcus phocae]
MNIPIFGQKVTQVNYTTRHGVYAVIPNLDKTEIILVQAPNGSWFLPGGEIEPGETQREALDRELLEELGFVADVGYFYGQADEYFYSRHRDTHFYHPAYLYEVTTSQAISKPLEDFNTLAWFPISEAIAVLKRDSHRWGVKEWQKKHH